MKKNIRNKTTGLKIKAESGDIRALFKLATLHSDQNYDNYDIVLAEKYQYKLVNLLLESKLRIEKVDLSEFRGIRKLEIAFEPDLTIFVGLNGTGKSSILDALNISLSWFVSNIQKYKKPGVYLKDSDINSADDVSVASVSTTLAFNPSNLGRFKSVNSNIKSGSSDKISSELEDFKELGSIYRFANEVNGDTPLPLVAYYSVSRLVEDYKNDSTKKIDESHLTSKFDAYNDLYKANRSDFNSLLSWLIRLEIADIGNKNKISITKRDRLITEISDLYNLMSLLSQTGKTDQDNALFRVIKQKEVELSEFELDINAEKYDSQKALRTIKFAIMQFIPNCEDITLEYSLESISLIIKKNGYKLNASQLSQGEKSLFCLVGDIARRLFILNSHLINPLEGNGIVIIDEIDLHLHAGWQQTVLKNLTETFPNVQFIVSTHSPQVLSTAFSRSIRILKEVTDQESNIQAIVLKKPSFETRGVVSSDVLAHIMGIDPLPDTDESNWVNQYLQLLNAEDQALTSEISDLWEKIFSHFGAKHPVTIQCIEAKKHIELKKRISERRAKASDEKIN